MTEIVPIQIVWHVDALRQHVENLCVDCHPPDCYVCVQAAMMGFAR